MPTEHGSCDLRTMYQFTVAAKKVEMKPGYDWMRALKAR